MSLTKSNESTGGRGHGSRSAPPYQRVQEQIRAVIRGGRWGAGTKIPSRKDLAHEYGVAIATMERAISALLEDGTLRVDGGRGTFVAEPKENVGPVSDRAVIYADAVVTSFDAPALRPAPRLNAALGILGTFYDADVTGREAASFWTRKITESLEQNFGSLGGITHTFNRLRQNERQVSISEAIQSLLADGMDAIVSILEDDPLLIEEIAAAAGTTPVIYITSGEIRRPLTHVFYDNVEAGFQAAQHLLERGHRHLMFLAPFETTWVNERIAGAKEALERLGGGGTLQIYPGERKGDPLSVVAYEYDTEAILREFFQGQGNATGVIAADDDLAIAFLRTLEEEGHTKKEYGVVGFDNNPKARLAGLTTLQPPLEALGREAARQAAVTLQNEAVNLQMRLRSHLIPRFSTRNRNSE